MLIFDVKVVNIFIDVVYRLIMIFDFLGYLCLIKFGKRMFLIVILILMSVVLKNKVVV